MTIFYNRPRQALVYFKTLNQACQTQTTLRATNATKTDKRAAQVLKMS